MSFRAIFAEKPWHMPVVGVPRMTSV